MSRIPDFRRATRDLISIGNEQMLIRSEIDTIQGVGDATTLQAWMAAREASKAATRMAKHFRDVAIILESLHKEEKANGAA